jgi:predicted Rossmann fold nucleotide-binding protein DprA/Smf involved in DNA uptake
MNSFALNITNVHYPAKLKERLDVLAPAHLIALGSLDLLALQMTAIFCSVRCPGNAILSAYDHARRWREEGRCVISGFHSPIEKECLKILLRGRQPIVICPARGIETMRLPRDWRAGIDNGRLLLLSAIPKNIRRPTAATADLRNQIVAAMADEVAFFHITPGGKMARLLEQAKAMNIRNIVLDSSGRQS